MVIVKPACGERDIVVAILEFVQTITYTSVDGFQNKLT